MLKIFATLNKSKCTQKIRTYNVEWHQNIRPGTLNRFVQAVIVI